MSVGEFLQHMGDRTLAEMSYRVAIASDLEMTLDDLERMPVRELDDWFLLYEVEAEAHAQAAENASRGA